MAVAAVESATGTAGNVRIGPAILNITGLRAGDQNAITMRLSREGVPLRLINEDGSDIEVSAHARRRLTDMGDPAMVAEIEYLDRETGQITMRWHGEDVRRVLAGTASWSGVWDLELKQEGGDPLTIVAGKLRATQDVTRPIESPSP